MTAQPKCHEQYPLWIVLLANSVSIATYLIGGFVILRFNFILLALYIMFILVLEVRLLRESCVNCYYYGKTCAFGKGRLSAMLFAKGDAKRFAQKETNWKAILPDFLVSIIPIVIGIIMLVADFDMLVLVLILSLVFLSTVGNGLVRSSLACRFCKQREIGCPAEKLFSKANADRSEHSK